MFDIDTKLTQPRCDCPQCSILAKLNPPTKSDLACGLAESRILDLWKLPRKKGWHTSLAGKTLTPLSFDGVKVIQDFPQQIKIRIVTKRFICIG